MVWEINLFKVMFFFYDVIDLILVEIRKYYLDWVGELEKFIDFRVMFINWDGIVIGDLESDFVIMDNYLDWKEIKGVVENGYG